ncbi:hypothetical protein LZ31DRAFT_96230 [Colletotrichum somersetense]|nr:hypothetical protein LZ31DRAFT_96230 [Colletotrichum somersetense]
MHEDKQGGGLSLSLSHSVRKPFPRLSIASRPVLFAWHSRHSVPPLCHLCCCPFYCWFLRLARPTSNNLACLINGSYKAHVIHHRCNGRTKRSTTPCLPIVKTNSSSSTLGFFSKLGRAPPIALRSLATLTQQPGRSLSLFRLRRHRHCQDAAES